MLVRTALRIVWANGRRYCGAAAGVALGVFLAVFQGGLYQGYSRDTTVVLDAIEADIWIVPRNQPTFDGFAKMDDLAYWRTRQVAGIADVARIVWGDAKWRNPATGGLDYAQVLGLDPESSIRCCLESLPRDAVDGLRGDGQVLVSRADCDKLGIDASLQGPFELSGRRAQVVGLIGRVRLFSTASLVVTDLDNARSFLQLPPSHVTYIVCTCRDRSEIDSVIGRLRRRIPDHDVLTAAEFHRTCSDYWKTNSGIGRSS